MFLLLCVEIRVSILSLPILSSCLTRGSRASPIRHQMFPLSPLYIKSHESCQYLHSLSINLHYISLYFSCSFFSCLFLPVPWLDLLDLFSILCFACAFGYQLMLLFGHRPKPSLLFPVYAVSFCPLSFPPLSTALAAVFLSQSSLSLFSSLCPQVPSHTAQYSHAAPVQT